MKLSKILPSIAFVEALSFIGQILHNRIERALYGSKIAYKDMLKD